MSDPQGAVWVSFNGEVYNFKDLRAELESRYSFRSTSDTEVLVYGYQAWGSDVFRRLNGMFAVALWDSASRTLLLARDRLGKKPLFYYWDGGRVVFGSELKALLAHPRVPRRVDPQSLAQFFAFGYVPTPRSILKDVYKVPQGAVVSFQGGTRTMAPFWGMPVQELPLSEADACDRLEALLLDSVRIRMFSDVPLGFFLSGGIDSSLVVALARRLGADVRTFTVGFQESRFDESPDARRVSEHLGTTHQEIRASDADLPAVFDQASIYYDEPYADSSLLPTIILSRLARAHVTVALSGDGGDELFCGYTRYPQFHRAGKLLGIPRSLRRVMRQAARLIPSDSVRKSTEAMSVASRTDLARWLVSIWKPDELGALLPSVPMSWEETAFQQTWDAFESRDLLTRFMASDLRSYLCDDILQKVDRASMACALEVRCPLLDYRIVELALSLPIPLKYRDGEQKVLLKKLLTRYVPRQLWDRPKQGFQVPLAQWYRTTRHESLRKAVDGLAEAFPGILSVEAMRGILRAHVEGGMNYSQKLFSLDMLYGWTRRYL